jgi:hypothetical protein
MKYWMLPAAIAILSVGLTACERETRTVEKGGTTVVQPTQPVPGPAGPTGPKGEPGKSASDSGSSSTTTESKTEKTETKKE